MAAMSPAAESIVVPRLSIFAPGVRSGAAGADVRPKPVCCRAVASQTLEHSDMLTLHGFWSFQGGLCLWAEDSGPAVKSRSQAMRSARPHPFAASASTLTAI